MASHLNLQHARESKKYDRLYSRYPPLHCLAASATACVLDFCFCRSFIRLIRTQSFHSIPVTLYIRATISKMYQSLSIAALSWAAGVYAQQDGTLTAETHPSMP